MKFIVRKKTKIEMQVSAHMPLQMVAHVRSVDDGQEVQVSFTDAAEFERVKLGDEYELKATQ